MKTTNDFHQRLAHIRAWLWILLLPLAFLWGLGAAIRSRGERKRGNFFSRKTVICYGNIQAGGSGKTPLALQTVHELVESSSALILRGYRGKIKSSEELDRTRSNGAELYGDEAWMVAQVTRARIWVGPKRVKSLSAIDSQEGIQWIVCDDGVQDPSFHKDVVVCAVSGDGRPDGHFLIPLGDGRDHFSRLGKSDAAIVTAATKPDHWLEFCKNNFPELPVFWAKREVQGFFEGEKPHLRPIGPVFAFSGVGNPDSFLATLRSVVPVSGYHSFRNHHFYSKRDAIRVLDVAKALSVTHIVTTDKDWSKVHSLFADSPMSLLTLRMSYVLDESYLVWLKGRVLA
ncbi:MAG: tetraacyldisaccharide 4'-kinase [Deltaproteobacteria bacterium]|nr:tetraacyldisaccharide 4'-kinase [Deltaproteobacteria bacterium]MBI3293809.1 tetraacyldisaccharide 4'-kinase [Deltaproteobacteria bacterium]